MCVCVCVYVCLFVCSELVARLLDSVRNTHATIPGDKLVFMVCVLNGPVKLFHSAAGRSLLVQTYVGHLISYLDHTMAKLDFKPEVKSNRDCMDCLGRLLETLADPELGTTDEDIERLVSLILSLLRLSKVITRNNPLYVCMYVCMCVRVSQLLACCCFNSVFVCLFALSFSCLESYVSCS